jgi:D-alanine-D-alanine ligase
MLPNERSKKKVIVLMGGKSEEHDVSLRSGKAVHRALSAKGYDSMPIVVRKDGSFEVEGEGVLEMWEALSLMKRSNPYCAFVAMHGPFGEDGRVQALLDMLDIPYVGSDVTGSALAMDKWLAKCVYRAHKIPTPDALLFRDIEMRDFIEEVEKRLGVPCMVKTTRLGSSVGVELAKNKDQLRTLIIACQSYGDVMCEQFKRGRELTCAVLEDAKTFEPLALPVIEIVTKKHQFFDYESKYDPNLSDEICPADIPEAVASQVQRLGVMAHNALMLAGFSRTDFIWDAEGLWALETNTIPGLTDVSLFPKAAKANGIDFVDLVSILVEGAVGRKTLTRKKRAT